MIKLLRSPKHPWISFVRAPYLGSSAELDRMPMPERLTLLGGRRLSQGEIGVLYPPGRVAQLLEDATDRRVYLSVMQADL